MSDEEKDIVQELYGRWSPIYDCCGCCDYSLTIRAPEDAIDTRDRGYSTDQTEAEVNNYLRQNGRRVGRLSAGKYGISYRSGTVSHGCGRINCFHYANYFVTSLGVLPGLFGTGNNPQVEKDLLELKRETTEYTLEEESDILIGYWPWFGNSYTNGSITWCLKEIDGAVLDWTTDIPETEPVAQPLRMKTLSLMVSEGTNSVGDSTLMPYPTPLLPNQLAKCVFMRDTGISAGGGCGCTLIECDNPDSPVFSGLDPEKPFRWKSRSCHPETCRFFTRKNQNAR